MEEKKIFHAINNLKYKNVPQHFTLTELWLNSILPPLDTQKLNKGRITTDYTIISFVEKDLSLVYPGKTDLSYLLLYTHHYSITTAKLPW